MAVLPDESSPHILNVNWMTPTTPCAVDMYTVYYRLIHLEQCNPIPGFKTKYTKLTDTSVDIIGLHAYTTYTVFVRASNDVGYTETSTTAVTGINGEK